MKSIKHLEYLQVKFFISFFALFLFSGVSTFANVVGVGTQNFNPITSGLDFVTVHSSETLKPCYLNCGLFLNYAVNSLPNFTDQSTGNRTDFVDSLFSSDLNFGVGLGRNWDFGVSIANVHSQSVEDNNDVPGGQFADTGLTDIRLNTKFRFFGDDSGGLAGVFSVNFNQIEDNPYAGDDGGPIFNFELAADTTIDRIALGANLGYRVRNTGDQVPNTPIEPLEDQVIASVAASYLFKSLDTKLIGEIFGSVPTGGEDNVTDRKLSTAEFLLGLKSDLRHDIALHAGLGTELVNGAASPDWRAYVGINFAVGPFEFCKEEEKREAQIVEVTEEKSAVEAMAEPVLEEDPFAGTPEGPQETFVVRDVLFEFNSSNLEPSSEDTLARLVNYVKRNDGFKKVTIVGHTDSVGPEEYNEQLSLERAGKVKETLVELGVAGSQIEAIGMGESQPITDNGNFQGRSLNRRVEFKIDWE